jgi:NAD(P)-dependent dehydrogenase (short-subunit alcohol dehydrogenase family)
MHTTGMLRKGTLDGNTIIVTGGGTGLGKSMTKYFLELGANVVITSRKLDVLEKTASELCEESSDKILPIACDVRNHNEVNNVIKETLSQYGQITGLVNNAAGNFISPTENLSVKGFDVIVDIVLKGTYNFSLLLGQDWIKKKQSGTVLNIVTTYAWTGSGFVAPSAAAKGGVLALTRSLAAEWGKYKIRTNAIAPGPFPTEGAWSRLFPKVLQAVVDPKKRIPLKRYGEHQELANLAAYLMSEYSAYINGDVITIDGGEWIHNAGEFNWLDKIPKKMWKLFSKR